jgi:hypothetical protein
MSAATASPGVEIRSDAVYDLPALKELGWGTAALRTARRRGLLVRRTGRKSWVFGRDLLAYIEQNGTVVS